MSSHLNDHDRLQTQDLNIDKLISSSPIKPSSNNNASQKIENNVITPQMKTQNILCKQSNHKKRKNTSAGKPRLSILKKLKQLPQSSADSEVIMSAPSNSTTRKHAPSSS